MLAGGACLALAGAIAPASSSALRPDTFSTASRAGARVSRRLRLAGRRSRRSSGCCATPRSALVATYAYVNPVRRACSSGWAILGEPLTFRLGVAGAIVVTGVALIASAVPPSAGDDESAGRG